MFCQGDYNKWQKKRRDTSLFLLYPESIPQDWQTKLETLGVPIAISPLHDKDLSSVEGQKYKKAHYHVIYISKNPVTAESVRLKIKRALGDKSVAKKYKLLSEHGKYVFVSDT